MWLTCHACVVLWSVLWQATASVALASTAISTASESARSVHKHVLQNIRAGLV